MFRRVVFVGLTCVASSVAADLVPLSGKAISDVVTGATIQLDTPLGTKLPVKYSADGLISGDAGSLAWFLGSATDRGRWWVANDRLCHKWFKWFDAEVQCLHLKQDGQRLHWARDDGKTGTATLLTPEPIGKAPYALGGAEVRADSMELSAPVSAPPKPAEHSIAPPSLAPKIADAKPSDTKQTARTDNKPSPKPVVVASAATSPALKPASPPRQQPEPPRPAAVASPQAAPPLLTLVSFRVARVDPDDVLNVRRGPSMVSPAVGVIPPQGQGVRLAGQCLREWCPITHNGVRGWVNRYYLVEDRPPYRR